MALKECEKCGKQISDKAQVCPWCGNTVGTCVSETNFVDGSCNQEVNGKNLKKNNRNSKIIIGILLVIIIVLISIIIAFKPKATDTKENSDNTSITQESQDDLIEKDANIELEWEDGTAPTEIGDEASNAKLLDVKILKSSQEFLLVMDLEYTNNLEEDRNLINDYNCSITPYQNGIALETPVYSSEEGIYDYTDAFTAVKKGGTVTTQLAWVLNDTMNPIELDFGMDESFDPDFSKILNLSGGTEKKNLKEVRTSESDYNLEWSNNPPETIGNDMEIATLKNFSIKDSPEYGKVLIIDVDYINNSESASQLMNSFSCRINPYQNGVALDSTGYTSEEGIYDYTDALTLVKKGGKVSTQLVWVLNDDSPIEIEFGEDDLFQPIYEETITFSK